MEKPNYYSIITADVRYDKRLTPNAKLLYAEITALTNMNGKCFATNKYFAELYGVDSRTISRWVSSLVECGYIRIELGQDDKNQTVRYIQLCQGVHDKNVMGGDDKNVYHNNTTKVDINNNLTDSNNKQNNNVDKFVGKKVLIEDGKFYIDDTMEEYKDILKDVKEDVVIRCWTWIYENFYGRELDVSWIRDRLKQFNNDWGNNGN